MLLDSLRRRMRAMHSLYADALATMDLSHVNHFEREGVLPIAFSLFHYTNMQDVSFGVISGQRMLWNAEWQARVQMAIDEGRCLVTYGVDADPAPMALIIAGAMGAGLEELRRQLEGAS